MKQNQRILNHLIDHGWITQVVASNYNIRRCASRICELKEAGIKINTEIRFDDAGVRYAYYYITPFVRKVERNRRDRGLPYHKVKKAA